MLVVSQRDGASFVSAMKTGCGASALTVESSEAVNARQHKGILVCVPHLVDEVTWGRGYVGSDVARNPDVDLFDGFPEESKRVEALLGDNTSVFNFVSRTRTATLADASLQFIHSAGDAVLPTNGVKLWCRRRFMQFQPFVMSTLWTDEDVASEMLEFVTNFLGNCLAIRQQHVLTLAVLKLVHDLVQLGSFNVEACAKLAPLLVGILKEDDPFTAVHDDDWMIGVKLLLRIKLMTVSVLHVMLDRAAHVTAVKIFQQNGSRHGK
jgi:hypothetical protein